MTAFNLVSLSRVNWATSLSAPRTVSATFTRNFYALGVTRAGNGTGRVASNAVPIDCGDDCSETIEHGMMVTLHASPASGSRFDGWSGSCSGAGACVVSMQGTRSVTATFIRTQPLNLAVVGGGRINVSTGGTCTATCTVRPDEGSDVTLTAVPGTLVGGFLGWGGVCTGQALTCVVTMDERQLVTAKFAAAATPIPAVSYHWLAILGIALAVGLVWFPRSRATKVE